MRTLALAILIVLCVSHGDSVDSDCLLSGLLHHPDTGICFHPFERGPCRDGEWIVLKDAAIGREHAALLVYHHLFPSLNHHSSNPHIFDIPSDSLLNQSVI
jgi:hypothetical protein